MRKGAMQIEPSNPTDRAFEDWWAEAQRVVEGRFVDAFRSGWQARLEGPHAYPPYRDLREERKRQDAQWGGPLHDDQHAYFDWLALIAHQMTRAQHNLDIGDSGFAADYAGYRERLVKIAALAIAAVESFDRKSVSDPAHPGERTEGA